MTTTVNENINTWLSQIHTEYKTAISVDCVIFGYNEDGLKVLTMKSDMPPFEGQYSLVGDLVHASETLDDAATRILFKRTGLDDVHMEQVQAFSSLDRHPLARVITVAYYSLVQLTHQLETAAQQHDMEWTDLASLTELAFDHKLIMDTCLQKLRVHLRERPIGFSLLPKKFSLKQLQNLYEVVLGIELDKRNFRRKLRNLDLLVDLKERQSEVNHRPAKLYKFDNSKYEGKKKHGFNFDL